MDEWNMDAADLIAKAFGSVTSDNSNAYVGAMLRHNLNFHNILDIRLSENNFPVVYINCVYWSKNAWELSEAAFKRKVGNSFSFLSEQEILEFTTIFFTWTTREGFPDKGEYAFKRVVFKDSQGSFDFVMALMDWFRIGHPERTFILY